MEGFVVKAPDRQCHRWQACAHGAFVANAVRLWGQRSGVQRRKILKRTVAEQIWENAIASKQRAVEHSAAQKADAGHRAQIARVAPRATALQAATQKLSKQQQRQLQGHRLAQLGVRESKPSYLESGVFHVHTAR